MVNWRRPKDQVPEELLDSFEWPAGWSNRDTVIERLQEQVANGGLSMETNEEVGDRFKEAIDYMVSDKSGVIGE
jgi:hypothetical protein